MQVCFLYFGTISANLDRVKVQITCLTRKQAVTGGVSQRNSFTQQVTRLMASLHPFNNVLPNKREGVI